MNNLDSALEPFYAFLVFMVRFSAFFVPSAFGAFINVVYGDYKNRNKRNYKPRKFKERLNIILMCGCAAAAICATIDTLRLEGKIFSSELLVCWSFIAGMCMDEVLYIILDANVIISFMKILLNRVCTTDLSALNETIDKKLAESSGDDESPDECSDQNTNKQTTSNNKTE